MFLESLFLSVELQKEVIRSIGESVAGLETVKESNLECRVDELKRENSINSVVKEIVQNEGIELPHEQQEVERSDEQLVTEIETVEENKSECWCNCMNES